jgi:hypothetical protein
LVNPLLKIVSEKDTLRASYQSLVAARLHSFGAVSIQLDLFCGDERYVALTLIGDLAKRNFAEKHHII